MIVPTAKRSQQAASCLGKEGFASPDLAMRAVRRQNQHRTKVNAYRCPHCHEYHLSGLMKK